MNATKMQSVLIQASRNRLQEEKFGTFIVVLAKLVLSETELLVPMKIQVIISIEKCGTSLHMSLLEFYLDDQESR